MEKENSEKGSVYQIRIKGPFDPLTHKWMDGVSVITHADNETVLVAPIADQSALRGVMEQLWNLNFTILSMEKIDQTKTHIH